MRKKSFFSDVRMSGVMMILCTHFAPWDVGRRAEIQPKRLLC